MSQLIINKLESQLIVNGLAKALCHDAIVHAKQLPNTDGTVSYQVHIQAYLPNFERGFVSPQIDISEETTKISFDLIAGDYTARTIKIIYTSKDEGKAPYSLWAFDIEYALPVVEDMKQAEFLKVVLRNTDPETTRGTVTTVEDAC